LEDKVEFLGFRSDVTSLLHAADALVLSSAWEGMPNAVMEALAAALPVVATRVGGVAELVDENSSGLIVPAQDPEALSSAMIAMMNLSQEQRNQMGEEGKRHVEESYGLQKVLGLWSRLFREVDAG
jgi:glycosyltransferase involved in cell wall biosynthesis